MTRIIPTLLIALLISACIHRPKRKRSKYYQYSESIIVRGADVLSTLELDTGNSDVLIYTHREGYKGSPHSMYGRKLYIISDSIEVWKNIKKINIPDEKVQIKTYDSYHRCSLCENDSVRGTIQKVNYSQDSVTLKLNLNYKGNDNRTYKLLKKTLTFRTKEDFWDNFFVDHKGEYKNLRIALKSPLKVKKLNLFPHKMTFGLDSLPLSINLMENLEELDASGLGLKKLPDSLGGLSNLKKLDLSYNNFSSFPEQILELENLEVLDLSLSRINRIPVGIKRLKNLRVLIVDDNTFEDFPLSITELTNLEVLSITSANISNLPKEITHLKKLRILDLSSFWSYKNKNTLTDISYLTELTNLEVLDLEWNRLERLPDDFCRLNKLRILNLQSNPLKEFPDQLISCSSLDTLWIDHAIIPLEKTQYKGKIQFMSGYVGELY